MPTFDLSPARAVLIGAALIFPGITQAGIAAITSQNAGALTLIDTDTRQVIATTPLPGKPAAVAMDVARGRIMAIAVETGWLHVFDTSGRETASWPLGGAPFGVAVRPESGTALVTDWQGTLREIDPATGRELRRWPVGATPSGVAVDGEVIVTCNRDANSISVIFPAGVAEVAVGEHPFGVTIHAGRAFVTNVLSDSVSVVDLADARLIATIPTGERPYATAFANGHGFVTNQYQASVTVFDAMTFAVLEEIGTDEYPEGIATDPGGNTLWIANWFSDTVQVIDAESGTILATIPVPEGPRAFGLFTGAASGLETK